MLAAVAMGVASSTFGCLLARGNGAPPVLHFLIGLVFGIGYAFASRNTRHRWTARLTACAISALASFALAWVTARGMPADTEFATVFGGSPPATIRNLQVRRQFSDGEMRFLSFTTDATTYRALLAAPALAGATTDAASTSADALVLWDRGVRLWSALAWDLWPAPATANAELTSVTPPAAPGTRNSILVFRDMTTGKTYVVALSD